MSSRLLATAALAAPLFLPQPALAQLPVRMSDVLGAIRIYEGVREIGRIAGAIGRARGPVHSGDVPRSDGGSDGGSTRGSDGSWGDIIRTAGAGMSSVTRARAAVTTGARYVGVPYVWGGSTPAGFDCSGFVQYAYRQVGVPLPRTSRQMAHAGESVPVRLSALREGDLMLFRGRKGVINHVAMYAGNDRILQSSSSGGGVRFDDLRGERGAYYRSHFVAARRVSALGPALMQQLEQIARQFPFDHFDLPDDAPAPRR